MLFFLIHYLLIVNTLHIYIFLKHVYFDVTVGGGISCYFFHQMPLLLWGGGGGNNQYTLSTRKVCIHTEFSLSMQVQHLSITTTQMVLTNEEAY
jgi:hypothetical protein